MKNKQLLFIKQLLIFTFSAFGGAQAHIALFLKYFVQRKAFISEQELLELYALSQILPGPASTQTLVGIGYKVGGSRLAVLTFLIWILPSTICMIICGLFFNSLENKEHITQIFKYIQPIAIGIVGYSALHLASTILTTRIQQALCLLAVIAVFVQTNAYIFPLAILTGGLISATIESPKNESIERAQLFARLNPRKLFIFLGLLFLFASLGTIIQRNSVFSLPVRLFENFYRNGIFIFGGGQVLIPLMYTEFVQMKHYLLPSEFLTGYTIQQAIPGPTFSFTAFLGTLITKNFGYNTFGQVLGGLIAAIGINLPGLILILYIVPFWNDLKKITKIKHSLSGVNAVCVGFIIATFFFLLAPLKTDWVSYSIILLTIVILKLTKLSPAMLILAGTLICISLFLSSKHPNTNKQPSRLSPQHINSSLQYPCAPRLWAIETQDLEEDVLFESVSTCT